MNSQVFTAYVEEQLLLAVADKSLVVMDNAHYHSCRDPINCCPTSNSTKGADVTLKPEKNFAEIASNSDIEYESPDRKLSGVGEYKLKFLCFIIDESGIRDDPEKVQAIRNMPEPTSISAVRRFFGMVNILSKFSLNLAGESKPFRDLLRRQKNVWMNFALNSNRTKYAENLKDFAKKDGLTDQD
ncbi:uncharacterized protein LOC125384147 [Haliotis rufescens]|uniref:uncharacterized protein LOC125384147 n=1 Tax=Haliotis rufescens TaxID=6454 RepID=UPI00201ED18A|nr:uncharacterized protein LOC125384147 [Haliotis rufescens]